MRLRPRLTLANLGATAALAVALVSGGSAVALNGQNTVDSGDIENQEVRSSDLRNDDVSGGDVRDEDLTGDEFMENSVTDSDVDESTLSAVFEAAHADEANHADTAQSAETASDAGDAETVDGLDARTFQFDVPDNAMYASGVLNLGGLSLLARCNNNTNNFELVASTTVANSYIRSSNGSGDALFNPGDNLEVQSADDGAEFLVFRRGQTGGTVSVRFVFDEGGDGCDLAGTAIGR